MSNRIKIASVLAIGTLLSGCGGSDAKAEACAAWDEAQRVSSDFIANTQDPVLPDTGDLEADVQTALDDLDERMDKLAASKEAVKDAFTKAANEDPAWEKVQAAAYEGLTSDNGAPTVDAACDRVGE